MAHRSPRRSSSKKDKSATKAAKRAAREREAEVEETEDEEDDEAEETTKRANTKRVKNSSRAAVNEDTEDEDDEDELDEVESEDEDEEVDEDLPVRRKARDVAQRSKLRHSDRAARLDEEDDAEEEVGVRTRTTTEKNAIRARRLRDLAEDGSIERNRTVTGTNELGRSVAKKIKTERHTVVATRLGFYGLERRYEGDRFRMDIPVLKSGKLQIPSWVVLEEDYEEPVQEKPKGKNKRGTVAL